MIDFSSSYADQAKTLTGGALIGVIVVVVLVVLSSIAFAVLGVGYFIRWVQKDNFTLKYTYQKVTSVEPDLEYESSGKELATQETPEIELARMEANEGEHNAMF